MSYHKRYKGRKSFHKKSHGKRSFGKTRGKPLPSYHSSRGGIRL